MKLMFPVLINHLINRFRIIHNEPFGLGRFAMDHPLTKAASRPLFVPIRRYAPQKYF